MNRCVQHDLIFKIARYFVFLWKSLGAVDGNQTTVIGAWGVRKLAQTRGEGKQPQRHLRAMWNQKFWRRIIDIYDGGGYEPTFWSQTTQICIQAYHLNALIFLIRNGASTLHYLFLKLLGQSWVNANYLTKKSWLINHGQWEGRSVVTCHKNLFFTLIYSTFSLTTCAGILLITDVSTLDLDKTETIWDEGISSNNIIWHLEM